MIRTINLIHQQDVLGIWRETLGPLLPQQMHHGMGDSWRLGVAKTPASLTVVHHLRNLQVGRLPHLVGLANEGSLDFVEGILLQTRFQNAG